MDRFDSYEEYLNFTLNAPDEQFYEKAVKANTKQAFENYIKEYSSGLHIKEAKSKVDEFIAIEKDNEAYNKAKSTNTKESYEVYLNEYPKGLHVKEANLKLKAIQEDEEVKAKDKQAWEQAKKTNSLIAYKNYIEKFPKGKFIPQAIQKRDNLVDAVDEKNTWEKAKQQDTQESYNSYLKQYPNGLHSKEARSEVDKFITTANDHNAYELAQKNDTIASYELYLKKYPKGLNAKKATERINKLKTIQQLEAEKVKDDEAFNKAVELNTKQAFKTYIKNYPNGLNTGDAKSKIDEFISKEKENKIFQRYRYLLEQIDDPFSINKSNSRVLSVLFVFYMWFILSFEYGEWWFLKGIGVFIAITIVFAMALEEWLKPILSPYPYVLKSDSHDISVTKEVFDNYKKYDIYDEYFIISKKTDNIFEGIHINFLKEHHHLIEDAINNLNKFRIKYFISGVVWAIVISFTIHSLSSSSVFYNNIEYSDLNKKENWIKLTKEVCEKYGGDFYDEENSCRAKWSEAKKICRASEGRLPTLDEYYLHISTNFNELRWTNTAVGEDEALVSLLNATFGLLPVKNLRSMEMLRYDLAYAYIYGGVPKEIKSINAELLVECLHGTNNYYLRKFDYK